MKGLEIPKALIMLVKEAQIQGLTARESCDKRTLMLQVGSSMSAPDQTPKVNTMQPENMLKMALMVKVFHKGDDRLCIYPGKGLQQRT